jgi:precorrin-8X/cobalt-precorrin-8 methylmutase
MALFDIHVVVDWSANGTPKRGADSIWIGVAQGGAVTATNPATRAEAVAALDALFARATDDGLRVLAGFDFPFGYPRGLSQAIRPGGDWRDVWARIADLVVEGGGNASNRFHAAAGLNALFPGDGPFWGNGLKDDIPGLPRKKPLGWDDTLPANRRPSDAAAKGAQEVWKLSGAGSVGSQALTGIAALHHLRARHPFRVWPFEEHEAGHVVAEVYPSLVPVSPGPGQVKDEAQVTTLARAFAAADAAGLLGDMLAAPLSPEERSDAAAMLGLSHVAALRDLAATGSVPALSAPGLRYQRDPAAIYAQSFATVRAEARLTRFPPGVSRIAERVIHACGMVEVADRLAYTLRAFEAGRAALEQGAPVLCDCEMVAAGVIRSRLPRGNPVVVTLNDAAVPGLAAQLGTTRSAAAVDLWRDRIGGAVVAIGNAPTALFHLLERLDAGWPRPALILGFPVGFVGAAESKAELARDPRGCDFVALKGRRGGSAMAAAAVNALSGDAP